jgi:hypothetical protein
MRNYRPVIGAHYRASGSAQPLSCRAYMSNARPGDYTKTVVHVRTRASVEVFTVAFYKAVNRAYFTHAASDGRAEIAYYVSGATPGRTVPVVVTVVEKHRASSCSTSFTPTRRQRSPSPAPTSHSPTPTPSHSSPAPSPSGRPGCHPRTPAGNCYEPGEYCPKADHGMKGVAGDGKAIVCEDNDGWRWESA